MERSPLQTQRAGLQLGRGPASGEKRQLEPQAISTLTPVFLVHFQAMLLSTQRRADRSSDEVPSQCWAQRHTEGSWKRMQAEQDRGEDEQGQHRATSDLGQPGNPAPNDASL